MKITKDETIKLLQIIINAIDTNDSFQGQGGMILINGDEE